MRSEVVISDIAEIIMGQSPKKKEVNEVGDGYPLLNGPTEFTERYPEPVQFTTEGKRFSESGDILFCVRGSTTGRMNYADQPYAIGRGIAAIRGKDGYPTPFVRAVIENNLDRLLAAATGSTFPNVSKSLLNEFDVEVISAEEAQEANEIIVSIENKIHLNQQTNETLEAMAQAIFKSWFVDFDPVRAKIEANSAGREPNRAAMAAIAGVSLNRGWNEIETALDQKLGRMTAEQQQQLSRTAELFPDELVESEIGEVPKGWDLKKVDELADVIDCLHSKKPERQKEGSLYLEVSNIGEAGKLDLSDKYFINEEDYKQWTKRIEVRKGDMVITKTGRVGALAYIPKGINAAIGRNIVAIRPYPKIVNSTFLRDAMLSDLMKREIMVLTSSGTILQSLHVKAVRKLRLIIPNQELLSIYEDSVSEMHQLISQNIFQNQSLSGLRDTLLPKLISGEVGV